MPRNNYLTKEEFSDLIRVMKNNSDSFEIKVSPMRAISYLPYVQITVKPKPFKGLKFETVGPMTFDLCSRKVTGSSVSKARIWSAKVKDDILVEKTSQDMVHIISIALSKSQKVLRKKVFKSALDGAVNLDLYELEMQNLWLVKSELDVIMKSLDMEAMDGTRSLLADIRRLDNEILQLRFKMHSERAGRLIKRLLTNSRSKILIKQHLRISKRIDILKLLRKKLDKRISSIKYDTEQMKDSIENQARKKALSSIDSMIYNPLRKDLLVHSSLILVPSKRK